MAAQVGEIFSGRAAERAAGPGRAVPRGSWLRRARPLLGTLVEVAVRQRVAPGLDVDRNDGDDDAQAVDAAFAAVAEVQACLSRFEPASDIARFHALPRGGVLPVRRHTAVVLAAARALERASDGLFDISLGSGRDGWECDGLRLRRLDGRVRLDLGGIGKGHAVDRAVEALQARGCATGWVNAGGDLRVFGDVELPLSLRDESAGGVRDFAMLAEGAFATSRYDDASRCRAHGPAGSKAVRAHASVAAPLCLWADALTKVVAISGDAAHPLLARHAAQAWLHDADG